MPEGRIVRQRQCQRRHRHARPVAELIDKEVVPDQERLLQRGGGDGKVLEEVGEDDRHRHHDEDDILQQPSQQAYHTVGVLLEVAPGDESREVEVYQEGQQQEPAPARPEGEEQEQYDHNTTLDTADEELTRAEPRERVSIHREMGILRINETVGGPPSSANRYAWRHIRLQGQHRGQSLRAQRPRASARYDLHWR